MAFIVTHSSSVRRISTLDIVSLKDESSDLQLILPNMAHRFLITRIVIVNEASQSYPDEMMTRFSDLFNPAHLSSSPH